MFHIGGWFNKKKNIRLRKTKNKKRNDDSFKENTIYWVKNRAGA